MSMAETGINESPGHHPGGHVQMGLQCKAEPDKHERTGGKAQRASWPFQSLEKHHQSTFGWPCPPSSLPPTYQGGSPLLFQPVWHAYRNCAEVDLCFTGKLRQWLCTTQARVLWFQPHSLSWVLMNFVLQVIETHAIFFGRAYLPSCSVENSFASINIFISMFLESRNLSGFQLSFRLVITSAWFLCQLVSKIKPLTCVHFEICRRVIILLFPENYLLTIAVVSTQNSSHLWTGRPLISPLEGYPWYWNCTVFITAQQKESLIRDSSWFRHLLLVCPWVSQLMSLGLSFFICKTVRGRIQGEVCMRAWARV